MTDERLELTPLVIRREIMRLLGTHDEARVVVGLIAVKTCLETRIDGNRHLRSIPRDALRLSLDDFSDRYIKPGLRARGFRNLTGDNAHDRNNADPNHTAV